jgi:hypothetical protein
MGGCTRKISQSMAATFLVALCVWPALAVSVPCSGGSPVHRDAAVIDEDTTLTGGLVLDGNSMMVVNCSLEVEGGVTVSGGARLTLRNVEMRLFEPEEAEPAASGFWFDVQGNSSLEMVNVSIETAFFQSFRIRVSDSSRLTFRGVYSMDWGGLTCGDGSTVAVMDSNCWSTFNVGGHSALTISGSRVFAVNVTDHAEARLDGVYATTTSVSGGGSLHINNSTISSETRGLHLRLDEGATLTLQGFPASPTGIDYWHLEGWYLREEGVALNVTLEDVYFRNVGLDVGRGGGVEVIDVNAPLEISFGGDALKVTGSTIDGVRLDGASAMSAEDASLSWLEAWATSSAALSGATVHRSESHNGSVVSYFSSTVDSLSCVDAAVVLMCGSPLPEDLLVGGDSAVVHFSRPVSAALLGYDVEEGALDLGLDGLQAEAELTVVLDRDRVRRRELGLLLDGEPVDYRVSDEKGLSYVSSRVSQGVGRVSVVLGPPPSERVPFLDTLLGQRLVTLLLVLMLVVFVLLTWR